jgi:formylglycine-generating enzyme required for sulfatase activity
MFPFLKPPTFFPMYTPLLFLSIFVLCIHGVFGASQVSNVNFLVHEGTKIVEVHYDLEGDTSTVSLAVSGDGGLSFGVSAKSATGDLGDSVASGSAKQILWDAGADFPTLDLRQLKLEVRAWDLKHESKFPFVKIPAGTYQVGNGSGDADITDAPVNTVVLDGFYMAVNDTTGDQWNQVRAWAVQNGYTDLAAGASKSGNHPVQMVTWYDGVKWANAASVKEGRTPCYRVDGVVYQKGKSDGVTCDWSANGYRLPTEAEWEVAARGGLSGKRFPLGDTLSHAQANYFGFSGYPYDLSGGVNDYHPEYSKGGVPFTSPVGSFASNGYGLNDMAGNVWQWCWDLYGPYLGGSNPRGAATGSHRVVRGGLWYLYAYYARCAQRSFNEPGVADNSYGFRLVRGRL